MKLLILLALSLVLTSIVLGGTIQNYTLIPDDNGDQFKVIPGTVGGGVAYAQFDSTPNATGWIYLSITTESQYSDELQSSGAGYLEGYLSYQSIYESIVNTYMTRFQNPTTVPDDVYDWVTNNINYMKLMIQDNPKSTYWNQVNLILLQSEGIVQGYNDAIQSFDAKSDYEYNPIEIVDVFILNMAGDILDLIPALMYQSGRSPATKKSGFDIALNSHCSSLVKLTDNLGELFIGHTTWDNYTSMLRTFKSYSFKFSQESEVVNNEMLFSSYPGCLTSIDDFYLLQQSKMVVTETTNDVFNLSLYASVTPTSVLSWIRVLLSNRLSSSGLEWCQTVSQYNSGTYNNQWIIVDYKKFTPYQRLNDGALYILEQLPGYIEYEDQTAMLRNGHWPSYNIPFYETVYNLSGYGTTTLSNQNETIMNLSYIVNPRSQLFRRGADTIHTTEDFQLFMRYNDYKNDPLSYGSPNWAIASRYDLNEPSSPDHFPGGGTDTKMTSFSLQSQNTILAISGPTSVNQPVFDWNDFDWGEYTHIGMPDSFDFPWISFNPWNYTIYS